MKIIRSTIARLALLLCLFLYFTLSSFAQSCHDRGDNYESSPNHERPNKTKNKDSISVIYSCPMHPDVVSVLPAKCSICSMDLVKKCAKVPNQVPGIKKIYYICNEHSNIVSGSKARCSTCGKKMKKVKEFIY